MAARYLWRNFKHDPAALLLALPRTSSSEIRGAEDVPLSIKHQSADRFSPSSAARKTVECSFLPAAFRRRQFEDCAKPVLSAPLGRTIKVAGAVKCRGAVARAPSIRQVLKLVKGLFLPLAAAAGHFEYRATAVDLATSSGIARESEEISLLIGG